VRSMDSILSDSPIKSRPTLEDAPQSSEKPDATSAEKLDVSDERLEQSTTARSGMEHDDGVDQDNEPAELNTAGLRKALGASRKEARERDKRSRELERQLAQLTGQMQAMQQRPAVPAPIDTPKDDSADFYADPAAYARRVADERGKTVEARLEEQRVMFRRERIADAQESYEAAHEDGKELLALFGQLAQQNPQLVAEFNAIADGRHPSYRNPVLFAAETARTAKRLQGVSSLDDFEKQLRAKWEAEQSGQSGDGPSARPTQTPKSIASSRGSGGAASRAAFAGPRSMDEILG